MLGQPPSKLGDDGPESGVDEDDLEADLRVIWSRAGCSEFEIILQDGIDESKALLFEGEGVPGKHIALVLTLYSTGVTFSYSPQTLGTAPQKSGITNVVSWDGQGLTPSESRVILGVCNFDPFVECYGIHLRSLKPFQVR